MIDTYVGFSPEPDDDRPSADSLHKKLADLAQSDDEAKQRRFAKNAACVLTAITGGGITAVTGAHMAYCIENRETLCTQYNQHTIQSFPETPPHVAPITDGLVLFTLGSYLITQACDNWPAGIRKRNDKQRYRLTANNPHVFEKPQFKDQATYDYFNPRTNTHWKDYSKPRPKRSPLSDQISTLFRSALSTLKL